MRAGSPKNHVRRCGVLTSSVLACRKLKLGPDDVFLQKAPVSFDASVQELFNSFACGGVLLLAAPGGEKDTQYLARLCKEQRVTCASFVPSQLDVLLQARIEACLAAAEHSVNLTYSSSFSMACHCHRSVHHAERLSGWCPCILRWQVSSLQEPDTSACKSIRHVLVGGEALPPALAARFAQRLPGTHLHNAYGPTETTVDATGTAALLLACSRLLTSGGPLKLGAGTGYDVTVEFQGGATVPIGRPIANLHCYVLDERLQLVPVGMPGELMVSGIQLARGYLKRPDLTAEKFITNPYSDGDNMHSRLYRTGGHAAR